MNKLLGKGVVVITILVVFLSLGILNTSSSSVASESYSESSTSQTYYDYLVNYQQKQANELSDFKKGISENVSSLKGDLSKPSEQVKTETVKYSEDKRSAVLGSLYGTQGKLELDQSAYSQNNPDILKNITVVSDTKPIEILEPPKLNTPLQTPIEQLEKEKTRICNTICHQEAYGQKCVQECHY
jgi:hypothetical protein